MQKATDAKPTSEPVRRLRYHCEKPECACLLEMVSGISATGAIGRITNTSSSGEVERSHSSGLTSLTTTSLPDALCAPCSEATILR